MVTPYAGVWIEIQTTQMNRQSAWVTPYAGVWIEIICASLHFTNVPCHSLRGSVD